MVKDGAGHSKRRKGGVQVINGEAVRSGIDCGKR